MEQTIKQKEEEAVAGVSGGNWKDAIASINLFAKEAKAAFVQRDQIIDALCDGLLAGQHVVLLGPPGTAKSALARAFGKAMQGNHFRLLMTKYTKPEEVVGPVSIRKIAEEDTVEVQTRGFLPCADTAFLDEIFKANSAILNALLTILNEREFTPNPALPAEKIQLAMCIGASNELPEDECGALWDRFMLRFWIDRIVDRTSLKQVIASAKQGKPEDRITARIDSADLAQAQEEVKKVQIPEHIEEMVLDVLAELRSKGIGISERSLVQALTLVQARAFRHGRNVATNNDIGILRACFWNKPVEQPVISEVILRIAFPLQSDLQRILDIAVDAFDNKIAPLRGEIEGEGMIDRNTKTEITTATIAVTELIQSQLAEIEKLANQNPGNDSIIEVAKLRLQSMDSDCMALQTRAMRKRVVR